MAPTATRSPWPRIGAIVLLLTALLSVIMIAFAWPATRSSVHDIPIAVAGPPAATAQVTQQLSAKRPGAFDMTVVDGTAAAERLILDREVYGAIDVSSGRPQLIIASAASPAVATGPAAGGPGAGRHRGRRAGPRPGPAAHRRPARRRPGRRGPAAGPRRDRRRRRCSPASSPAPPAASPGRSPSRSPAPSPSPRSCSSGSARSRGPYWLNAGAVALGIAATALTILGLESLLGAAGLGLGAATMMLLGNPLSGLASAPEMLPSGWGTLGPVSSPRARRARCCAARRSSTVTRAAPHVWVLLGWAALGLALAGLAAVRTARRPAG